MRKRSNKHGKIYLAFKSLKTYHGLLLLYTEHNLIMLEVIMRILILTTVFGFYLSCIFLHFKLKGGMS